MDTSHVWKRIEAGEATSAREAWALLRAMIDDARLRDDDSSHSLDEAAITVVSALDRMDQRETDRETLLFELRSERGRHRALDELLVRMLDRNAKDHVSSLDSALAAIDQLEQADRAAARVEPQPVPPPSSGETERRNRRVALSGCGLIAAILALLLLFKIVRSEEQRRYPTASVQISGAVVELISPEKEAGRLRMEADWATRAISSSSSWNPLERAIGWPDIYLDPELDSGVVWTPRSDGAGSEFIEVGWNYDLVAGTIVIVEGAGGGAIVAVDEIAGVDENRLGTPDYVRLWSGRMEASRGPRFSLIHLPKARPMRAVRIVFDTSIVSGSTSIDAIGLIKD